MRICASHWGIGRGSLLTPLYDVELELVPPMGVNAPRHSWTPRIGLIRDWYLPFAVLLGQLGWFDTFATTIDSTHTTVDIPDEG